MKNKIISLIGYILKELDIPSLTRAALAMLAILSSIAIIWQVVATLLLPPDLEYMRPTDLVLKARWAGLREIRSFDAAFAAYATNTSSSAFAGIPFPVIFITRDGIIFKGQRWQAQEGCIVGVLLPPAKDRPEAVNFLGPTWFLAVEGPAGRNWHETLSKFANALHCRGEITEMIISP